MPADWQADRAADLAPKDGLSFVVGTTGAALRRLTIAQIMHETVAKFGPRDAVIVPGVSRLTYSGLEVETARLAQGLLALGLRKGDRLGLWSPNRLEWVLTQFATARIGVILVNINPAYRLTELEYALNKVGCKAIVLAERFKTSDYVAMLQTLAPELADHDPHTPLNCAKLPALKTVITMGVAAQPGCIRFDEVMGHAVDLAALRQIEAGLSCDDVINIQFTSGTTGAPRGATLTHYNIVNNARFTTDRIHLTEHDKMCIPVPLYHCFGMVMGALGCLTKGAAFVLPGEAFSPQETLRAVAAEKCTALYGVPTMFVAMLEHLETEVLDLSSLRTGIMAGAPCPIEVMRAVINQMHMSEVTICYGMTETSPVSFQSFTDDPIEARVTTVGRVHPHLEVKITDQDGALAPVGEIGALCTRGYSVMPGYWNDPKQTAECIDAEGWMLTGDLAMLDRQGYCSITGRVKDMVIRGGENIYPREIEEFLYRHECIKEAQVFGIPDAKLGEALCAWIVLRPGTTATAQDIQDFCRPHIAYYKIPQIIRFVDALPATVTGKPQKFIMRAKMIEELGLAEG
ncbi:MAG: AMP-binding protein [Rhodobacteraceae bacterium]|nr:AMP-binding protein [Paracoccaceae bacterium]